MLSRDIYRLYDDISDPPPILHGAHYAQSMGYFTMQGDVGANRVHLPETSVFKYSSIYAPYTNICVPVWKPKTVEAGITQINNVIDDPKKVYQVVNTGSQGISLVFDQSYSSIVSAWDGSAIQYQTQSMRNLSYDGFTYPVRYRDSNKIIVSFDRSKYIFIPTFRAMDEQQHAANFWVSEYLPVMADYPYIIEIYGRLYYKSDLASNSGGEFAYIYPCASGANIQIYHGSTSGKYEYDYEYRTNMNSIFYFAEKSYGGGGEGSFYIFNAPPLFGCKAYQSGTLPAPTKDCYKAGTDQAFSGGFGSHSTDIMKVKDFTPGSDVTNWDNYHSYFYVDFDTAIKIVNATGFIWAYQPSDIADYHGEITSSDNIKMPVVSSDGSTTTENWTGSEFYQHWNDTPENSNNINTFGDILNGTINLNAPADRTDETDTKELSEDTEELKPVTPLLNGLGVFASYYALTNSAVMALSDFLWTADESVVDELINTLKLFGQNPVNAIMSLRLYPFDLFNLLTEHTVSDIILGRVDTEVNALKITNTAGTTIDLGTLYIKSYFNDFRDFAPYSSYNLYIPFIGTVNLNPNDVMNKIINVKMIIDITTGKATAIIYAAGIPIQYLDGMIGIDIPITSTNSSELLSSVVNAVGYTAGAVASAAGGNFVAAAGSLAMGAADVLFNDVSINKQGNVSPAASLSAPVNAYVIISRPSAVIPPNYGHVSGYACDKTAIINSLAGFTVCENVDTTGITATEQERNEIKTLLEGGVYL